MTRGHHTVRGPILIPMFYLVSTTGGPRVTDRPVMGMLVSCSCPTVRAQVDGCRSSLLISSRRDR